MKTDYVQKPDWRILLVLTRLCARYEKLYCYPSMATIAEFVFKFTGRSISRRTLCRHLGALVRDGWIARQRRHETNALGGLQLHSTLYVMTARTVKWVRSVGTSLWIHSVAVAKSLMTIAVPVLAQTLARESNSYHHRAAQAPPRTRPWR